MIVNS
jgi:hypothetical protein